MKDAKELMAQMKEEDMSLGDLVTTFKKLDIRVKLLDAKINKILEHFEIPYERI